MNRWHVHFSGTPYAEQEGIAFHPRAREGWALLAFLVLPRNLLTLSSAYRPQPFLRADLALRVWKGYADPRTNLRQALRALEALFEGCFDGSRDSIRVKAGVFESDMERVVTAYHRGVRASTPEERLSWLLEAEANIHGRFLEGYTPAPEAGGDVELFREHAHQTLVRVLLALAETQETMGYEDAALATALKALDFCPEHARAYTVFARLLGKTGHESERHLLQGMDLLDSPTTRLEKESEAALTPKGRRWFRAFFQSELKRIPAEWRDPYLRLSYFPAAFTAPLAQALCEIPHHVLESFTRTALLKTDAEGRFFVPPLVRERAWRMVPTPTKRLLEKQLGKYCESWLPDGVAFPPEGKEPFGSLEQAKPFLNLALNWTLNQPPEDARLGYFYHLHFHGLSDLAVRGIDYLDAVLNDEKHSTPSRMAAGNYGAIILNGHGRFQEAAQRLESALSLRVEEWGPDRAADMRYQLAVALHYSGEHRAALASLGQIAHYHRGRNQLDPNDKNNRGALATALRFRCEIELCLGEVASALEAVSEAVQLQRLSSLPECLADALYWQAVTLYRSKRLEEAEDSIEEALRLWQEGGDTTGIAFCLRLLAQLDAARGRFPQAVELLKHALVYHEARNDAPSRWAVREVLGDIFLCQNRPDKARLEFEECLRECRNAGDMRRGADFQARIERMAQTPIQDSI